MRTLTTNDSSQIYRIEYDADTREMNVVFANGASYMYHGVPREIFGSLCSAESIGSLFNYLKNLGLSAFDKVS